MAGRHVSGFCFAFALMRAQDKTGGTPPEAVLCRFFALLETTPYPFPPSFFTFAFSVKFVFSFLCFLALEQPNPEIHQIGLPVLLSAFISIYAVEYACVVIIIRIEDTHTHCQKEKKPLTRPRPTTCTPLCYVVNPASRTHLKETITTQEDGQGRRGPRRQAHPMAGAAHTGLPQAEAC